MVAPVRATIGFDTVLGSNRSIPLALLSLSRCIVRLPSRVSMRYRLNSVASLSSFIWCATNITLSRLIINVRRHSEESLLASASLEHLDADPEGDHELRVQRSMTYETFPERFALH